MGAAPYDIEKIIEILPGISLPRIVAEEIIEVIIDALNRCDGDPDFEDHPLHGQHDGREPDDGDYEWDARDGENPPVDPVTGLDVVQDEWKAYPEIWRMA